MALVRDDARREPRTRTQTRSGARQDARRDTPPDGPSHDEARRAEPPARDEPAGRDEAPRPTARRDQPSRERAREQYPHDPYDQAPHGQAPYDQATHGQAQQAPPARESARTAARPEVFDFDAVEEPPGTPTAAAPGPARPPKPTPSSPPTPHPATPWHQARRIAERAVAGGRAPERVALAEAGGLVLAAPLAALTDLPPFDTSAMDGWAVAGPGPWQLRAGGALAGHAEPKGLEDGEAVAIATGARVPYGSTAVLRSEHGQVDARQRLHAVRESGQGQDIRPRGQECRSGDQLLPLGTVVTPAVLGLAAAAGYDGLLVVPRPRVEVLVLGDELLTSGLPREGLIRDALGPMLPSWLRSLGAEVTAVHRLGDDAEALRTALAESTAEVLVTTGGTAAGPLDHVHPTLRRLGARLLVDGVEVRPGHPMLLARLPDGRHLVGLPGNPLAAVSGLLTLAEPLLRVLSGRIAARPGAVALREEVPGHPRDTRLVPAVLREGEAVPLHFSGPAMLRGIAGADVMVVVPPGGGRAGEELLTLDLPWSAFGDGECFT
ncbi:molybdopterin molybdotransferase MoeA [Streptomyces physcomitrii]|uniref:molybdopterin molybdotransferase MoeA n=1 Tax=Streptomyces physcomitrii TaxID=2724184 RepID=UPI00406BD3B4